MYFLVNFELFSTCSMLVMLFNLVSLLVNDMLFHIRCRSENRVPSS